MSDELRVEYPLAVVCRVLEIPRSSFYAPRALLARAADMELQVHSERIAGQWPPYGYRRVTAKSRREGEDVVNDKRAHRLTRELGLASHTPQRRCHTTNSAPSYPRYPNLVADLPIVQTDAVWVDVCAPAPRFPLPGSARGCLHAPFAAGN